MESRIFEFRFEYCFGMTQRVSFYGWEPEESMISGLLVEDNQVAQEKYNVLKQEGAVFSCSADLVAYATANNWPKIDELAKKARLLFRE